MAVMAKMEIVTMTIAMMMMLWGTHRKRHTHMIGCPTLESLPALLQLLNYYRDPEEGVDRD